MHFVIVGAMPVTEAMQPVWENADCLIAADAGWQTLERLGLQGDIFIGDYDSGPVPPYANVERLPREKDDTDTLYAAKRALQLGATKVTLLGATGGRLDHTMANLHTLVFLEQNGVEAWLADETTQIRALLPGRYTFSQQQAWVSVFPLGKTAGGVTLQGLRYPLQNAQLQYNFPVGVSNEFAAQTAEISVKTGGVYVFFTKMEPMR